MFDENVCNQTGKIKIAPEPKTKATRKGILPDDIII
jgi:hypothetical protein